MLLFAKRQGADGGGGEAGGGSGAKMLTGQGPLKAPSTCVNAAIWHVTELLQIVSRVLLVRRGGASAER